MKIIGHRGARGLAPENTLAAITQGLDHGAQEVEIDVRVTKDGVCVLQHDAVVADAAGNTIADAEIANHTLAELRAKRTDLATLDQAIELINRRVPLYIEVKPKVATAPVIAVLQQRLQQGWQPTDFYLASFSQRLLLDLHRALPDVPTVVTERFSGVRAVWHAKQLGTPYIALQYRFMWWGFIRSMHRRGYKLAAFTLNDPAKAKRWERYGLYAVITDYPDRFQPPTAS